jgi:hypothetical protein
MSDVEHENTMSASDMYAVMAEEINRRQAISMRCNKELYEKALKAWDTVSEHKLRHANSRGRSMYTNFIIVEVVRIKADNPGIDDKTARNDAIKTWTRVHERS